MVSRVLLSALLISLLLSFSIQAGPQVISQIKLKPISKEQHLKLYELGLDILETGGRDLQIMAKPADLAKLSEAGIDFEMIHPDVTEFYVSRNLEAKPFGGFRTFSQIELYLDSLAAANPTLMTAKFSIGQTLEGRQQWVVKISDNPNVDEGEPEVFYAGLIHAREPISAASQMYFMEYLLTNYGTDPQVTELVDGRELYFLPVQNPDGYVYNETTNPAGGGMWRKNRRNNLDGYWGVDLNRNYSYAWGYDNVGSSGLTSSDTYRGTAGFSEPETDNVRNYIISRDFRIIYNMHSYSNLEIWPICYDRFYSSEEDFFVNLGDSLTQYNGYSPGIGWTLYPTNGDADDWAWCDVASKPRIVSLTVEIGSETDGFWPDPTRIPELVAENMFPCFYLAQIADFPYVIAPPKAPDVTCPATSEGSYTVSFSVADTVNPAASYRLVEYTGRQKVTDDAEVDHGYWEIPNMTLSSVRSHTGTYSWSAYNLSRMHHWLLSATPYEVGVNDTLKFWMWYDLEPNYDYFYAQISTDGGYIYENLANNMTTDYDPNGANLGNGITGSSGDWVEARFDLSAYEGQQVYIRLAYFTDDWTVGEGLWIDDIANVQFFDSETEVGTGITATSVDFPGRSTGDYFYRVKATDADNQEGRFSSFAKVSVSTGETYIVGDVDGSGAIDIADLVYMVNYMFAQGPEPDPLALADMDCDGSIDIGDLVYLVNYMFAGGPPAAC